MFKKFTNGCVKLVQRFLPDAFVFCIILTIVVFIAAMPVAGMNPIEVANAYQHRHHQIQRCKRCFPHKVRHKKSVYNTVY